MSEYANKVYSLTMTELHLGAEEVGQLLAKHHG